MKKKGCEIHVSLGREVLVIDSDYDARFVKGLKAAIPVGDREYDGKKKQWRVHWRYQSTVEKLAVRCFDTAELVEHGLDEITYKNLETGRIRTQPNLPLGGQNIGRS